MKIVIGKDESFEFCLKLIHSKGCIKESHYLGQKKWILGFAYIIYILASNLKFVFLG